MGRRQQAARRARRAKDYVPLYGSGRVACTVPRCTRTFRRTPFNLSRLYCTKCAIFYDRDRKREAHERYRRNPAYRARDAAYQRNRRKILRRAA